MSTSSVDTTIHNAARIPAYEGPHEIPGIRFRHARQTLGVTAWGMNVIELDAGCTDYPEHDHVADGQEEVYVVLEGSAELHLDGAIHPMQTGDLVRVAPNRKRKLITTDSPVRVLALGGTPGAVYEPNPGM